jgi:hypothetical protein
MGFAGVVRVVVGGQNRRFAPFPRVGLIYSARISVSRAPKVPPTPGGAPRAVAEAIDFYP